MLLCHNLKSISQKMGFSLTRWISSQAVLATIPETQMVKKVRRLDQNSPPLEGPLGVQWCVQFDHFKFRIVIHDRPPEKSFDLLCYLWLLVRVHPDVFVDGDIVNTGPYVAEYG